MEMTIAWRRMQKARGHCLQRREATLRQLRLRSIQSLSLSLSLSLSRERERERERERVCESYIKMQMEF